MECIMDRAKIWEMFMGIPTDIKIIIRKYFMANKIRDTVKDSYRGVNGIFSANFNEKDNLYVNMNIFEYDEKVNLFVYKVPESRDIGSSCSKFITSARKLSFECGNLSINHFNPNIRNFIKCFDDYDFCIFCTMYGQYFGLDNLLLKMHKTFDVNKDYIKVSVEKISKSQNKKYKIKPNFNDLITFFTVNKFPFWADIKGHENTIRIKGRDR